MAAFFLAMREIYWLNDSVAQAGGYAYAVELDFAAVDAHRVACYAGRCYCAGDWCFVGIPAEALDLNYSIYLHSWFICAVAGSVIIVFLTLPACFPLPRPSKYIHLLSGGLGRRVCDGVGMNLPDNHACLLDVAIFLGLLVKLPKVDD